MFLMLSCSFRLNNKSRCVSVKIMLLVVFMSCTLCGDFLGKQPEYYNLEVSYSPCHPTLDTA